MGQRLKAHGARGSAFMSVFGLKPFALRPKPRFWMFSQNRFVVFVFPYKMQKNHILWGWVFSRLPQRDQKGSLKGDISSQPNPRERKPEGSKPALRSLEITLCHAAAA